jgi:hypothetical protein
VAIIAGEYGRKEGFCEGGISTIPFGDRTKYYTKIVLLFVN